MYEDETLVCRDCGQEFVFSASEQAFFAEKGFMNKPSRCPKCRALVAPRTATVLPLPVRCMTWCARTAARLPRCPSSPVATVPCSAVSASTLSALPAIN